MFHLANHLPALLSKSPSLLYGYAIIVACFSVALLIILKKQLGKERVYFILQPPGHRTTLREVRAETEAETMEDCLLACSQAQSGSYLSFSAQAHSRLSHLT